MLVAQNWLSRLLRGVNPSWDGVSAEEMDAASVLGLIRRVSSPSQKPLVR